MGTTRVLKAGLAAAAMGLLFPQDANAYLDPGGGSYLYQILLAGLVGIGFVIRVYWSKIRRFLFRIRTRLTAGRTREDVHDGRR